MCCWCSPPGSSRCRWMVVAMNEATLTLRLATLSKLSEADYDAGYRQALKDRPSLSLWQINWLIDLVERWELGSSKGRVSSAVLTTLRRLRAELSKGADES